MVEVLISEASAEVFLVLDVFGVCALRVRLVA
jgi:hypothetical protein